MDSDNAPNYPHACSEMVANLQSGEVGIQYVPYAREYGIVYPESIGSLQKISHCPWCGAELPPSTREVWGELLDDMGLFSPFMDDRERVPEEFWTDEWWRCRGL